MKLTLLQQTTHHGPTNESVTTWIKSSVTTGCICTGLANKSWPVRLPKVPFSVNFQWLKKKQRVFRGTGRVTLCSCPLCFLPWSLIEAKAGLLYTGSAAGLSEGAVKLTTSGRLSYSSVTLTTHSDADTLPLPSSAAGSWQGQKCFPTRPLGSGSHATDEQAE